MRSGRDNRGSSPLNKCKQSVQPKHICGNTGGDEIKMVPAHNNVLIFHHQQYPFNYQSLTQKSYYKTTLHNQLTKEQISKLASMDHPALIQVLKIGKGQQISNSKHSYSLYYEAVPYSLKKFAVMQDQSHPIMAKLFSMNLKFILNNLNEYLSRSGVAYNLDLQDIGVTNNGEIKIFVSPLAICGCKRIVDYKLIKKSISKIVSWWQVTLSSQQSSNIPLVKVDLSQVDEQKTDYLQKEVSQIMDDEEIDEKDGMEKLLKSKDLATIKDSYRLKASYSSYRVQNPIVNPIEKHIQQIRSKIIQKFTRQSAQKVQNLKGFRSNEKCLQQQRQQPKMFTESQRLGEYKHQNINCINIYTQSIKKTEPKINKIIPQPNYSFQINPQKAKQSKYSKMFPQFDHYCDSQSIQSNDTYQMELLYQKQPNEFLLKSGSFYFTPQANKQQKQLIGSKNLINQASKNKTTESAGPLQFKAIINKIKPIIADKDTLQNTIQTIPQKLRSQSLVNSINGSKAKLQMGDRTSRHSNISSVFNRIKSLKKDHKISDSTTCKQDGKNKDVKMNELVKNALQKSKNAIALLNRAKLGHSPQKLK